jgi:hypothetical protein
MSSIWIGFDPRESAAFAVARRSIRRRLTQPIRIEGIVLDEMRQRGLYTRPTRKRLGRLYDEISEHEMATEFAISRFLTPHLAKTGWAMFADCDVQAGGNVARAFNLLDNRKALYCVKHQYTPRDGEKMDGQVQANYARKNWSSVMIFNCDHPSNRKLTLDLINGVPGRDLHRFCWLEDDEIGELDASWNWLVLEQPEPKDVNIVHYTLGGPWLPGFEDVPYANEWRGELMRWAA